MIVTSFECGSINRHKCYRCKKPIEPGTTIGMDYRYNTYCMDCVMTMQQAEQDERDWINETPETSRETENE